MQRQNVYIDQIPASVEAHSLLLAPRQSHLSGSDGHGYPATTAHSGCPVAPPDSYNDASYLSQEPVVVAQPLHIPVIVPSQQPTSEAAAQEAQVQNETCFLASLEVVSRATHVAPSIYPSTLAAHSVPVHGNDLALTLAHPSPVPSQRDTLTKPALPVRNKAKSSRSGPLDYSKRKKAEAIRNSGACWRCRRYKKPVGTQPSPSRNRKLTQS